ncbi:MAG: hypothetical protein L3J24_07870 [Xanthomonadales bacterium]|nr:hypothetical protein [Xanthomonadales bacterium]
MKPISTIGLALGAVLLTGTIHANTTHFLRVDNQSSLPTTVVVSKVSDGSDRQQKVFNANTNGGFRFESTCNTDKAKKRDYLVYKGKYPSPGGNAIVGSGTLLMSAISTGGICSKVFDFKATNNNSGTGITIKARAGDIGVGTLHISDS